MKKIIPFKKEIKFKTNLYEITSISLDHELKLEDYTIKGNLLVSGSYKINDVSLNVEEFKYNIPVNIEMSDNYILDDIKMDIEDFYYEIIDNNILNVNIEVSIDNLEEIKHPIILDDVITPVNFEVTNLEDTSKDLEYSRDIEDVKSLFDNIDDSNETFSTYKVCIIKETDTIENIVLKYGVTKEVLSEYNDITDIKIGDKLIIPSINETNK
jgi:LysM repeat protein